MDRQPFSVLYVEDNDDNRLLVRRVLQAEGFDVFEARSAAEGYQSAYEHRPDLILVDINMPDVDGLTLTSRLKQSPGLAQIPIVALTANVMRGDRERTILAGCDGYIQKPIDVDILPRQIARFLQPQAQHS
jgi:two-component system cell cycle response regulator DivK